MSDVLIIAASNNKNLELANLFKENLNTLKVESEILDLAGLELPLYSPIAESRGIPSHVNELLKKLEASKGFVFVSPEYNGGVPPTLSNFVAWVSRAGGDDWRKSFNAKPAAIASFSGGGGFQLLMALRMQLSYIGLNVIGRQVQASYRSALNPLDVEAVSELLARDLN